MTPAARKLAGAGCLVLIPFLALGVATAAAGTAGSAAESGDGEPLGEESLAVANHSEFASTVNLTDLDDLAYGEYGDDLAAIANQTPDDEEVNGAPPGTDDDPPPNAPDDNAEVTQAAEDGALAGLDLARERGVEVTPDLEEAAIESATRAAETVPTASPDAVRAGAKGATHGAVLQHQAANGTQIQAGIYGSTAGALTQAQEASVTQVQSAAYGAAHGTVAQHQHVNVTQVQYAATGAAAGTVHAAVQKQQTDIPQLQEAAQGSGYGALVQHARVTVTQIQAAAFGSAGGAVTKGDEPRKDPKKVQETAMGAAEGSLLQIQRVAVGQEQHVDQPPVEKAPPDTVEAAARGSARGTILQVQHVSITQIQHASKGAAHGAISQYQQATVTQIQAAAAGGAQGTLLQRQRVDIIQIQHAAFGASKGAATTAAQHGIVQVEQIQAAAKGAGQGSVIQIQQVNVRQVQVIAHGAASGALSQFQQATVVQIQQAARGASDGALSVTQIQIVTIQQIQIISERAARDTAKGAADADVDHDEKIYKHGKGTAKDPEPDDEPDLTSLFFDTDDRTLFLANPNQVSVTVTITSEAGDVQTMTLPAGAMDTIELDPGSYTVTAEDEAGRTVKLAGRESISIAIGDDLESLSATVEDRHVHVTNPNDVPVVVTVTDAEGEHVLTKWISRTDDRTLAFDPGTYTMSAETDDEQPVQIEGQDEFEFTIEPTELHLGVTVTEGEIAVSNPTTTAVTVTATHDETGEAEPVDVDPESTATRALDPGPYTLTGDADERQVFLNGQAERSISVPAPPDDVDLGVSVEGENVTIDNPADTNVTVTATDEAGVERTLQVPAMESISEPFEPGNYTLTGEAADDRAATLNGEETFTITIEDPAPDPDPETEIDSCRELTEPGSYKLTADLQPESGDTCLEILTDGVTITGNGHTVDGADLVGGIGITVDTTDLEGASLEGAAEEVIIEDLTIANWERGMVADGAAAVSLADAAIRDNEWGMELRTATTVADTTVEGNANGGIDATTFDELLAISNSAVRDNGMGISAGDSTLEIDKTTVEANDGVGVAVSDGRATVTDSTVANNVVGITHWFATYTIEDVSLNDNEIWAISPASAAPSVIDPPRPPHTAPSSEIVGTTVLGEGIELDIDSISPLALARVDQAALPSPPADAEAVDDGVNVTQLGGTVDLVFDLPPDVAEEDIELQRHDGDEWTTVEDATIVGGALEATVGQDGLYAPLVVETEPINVTVTVEDDAVTLDNPADIAVTVTAAPEEPLAEDRIMEVPAEDTITETFEAGTYLLTGEAADEREVLLNGQAEYSITIDEPPAIDLNVTVENGTVTIDNPNETGVTVTAVDEFGVEQLIDVPAAGTATEEFEPGTYTLTGEADDQRDVFLNGEAELSITIEEPEPIDLTVTVTDETVTLDNPSDTGVTVTATDEAGDEIVISVPAAGSATESLDPGTYTLTGVADDDSPVTLEGEEAFVITIEAPAEIDLSVTVEEEAVTITNPGEAIVTVTATEDATGMEQVFDVPPGQTVTESLDPGDYTLTGSAPDADVLLDGQESLQITVMGPVDDPDPPEDEDDPAPNGEDETEEEPEPNDETDPEEEPEPNGDDEPEADPEEEPEPNGDDEQDAEPNGEAEPENGEETNNDGTGEDDGEPDGDEADNDEQDDDGDNEAANDAE